MPGSDRISSTPCAPFRRWYASEGQGTEIANFGYDDLTITIDDDEGGSAQDISEWVLGINGVAINAMTEETHAAGDSWVEQLFTGLKSGDDVTLNMLLDSTTMEAYFANSEGEIRSFSVADGAETHSGEVVIKKKSKIFQRGQLTKMDVVLGWTGTITTS